MFEWIFIVSCIACGIILIIRAIRKYQKSKNIDDLLW